MYGKVDVFPGDENDVALDPAGYTGQFFRPKNRFAKNETMPEKEFVRLLTKHN